MSYFNPVIMCFELILYRSKNILYGFNYEKNEYKILRQFMIFFWELISCVEKIVHVTAIWLTNDILLY